MLSEFRGWQKLPSSPSAEAAAAARYALAGGSRPKILLGYTPVARVNPFQALLYTSFHEVGIHTAPIPRAADFAQYAYLGDLADVVAVHVHWPSFVLRDVTSAADARSAAHRFQDQVRELKAAGVRLVYTVHNVIPHDARFLEEEAAIQQFLVDQADVVHLMSAATVETAAEVLRFDESRVVVSPHPSYRGAYPDYIDRRTARLTLGIDPDEVVYVAFGALKPYKALDRLLPALTSANRRSGRRRRLLVAGGPDDSPEVTRFIQEARLHPDVLVSPGRVPSEHVQYYMRAADFGLAPYRRMLNSGAVLLYQTFGLPVLVPDVKSIWENLTPDIAQSTGASSIEEIAHAMLAADRLLNDHTPATVLDRIAEFDPDPLSRRFGAQLRERLTRES